MTPMIPTIPRILRTRRTVGGHPEPGQGVRSRPHRSPLVEVGVGVGTILASMSAIEQSGPYAALAPRQRYLPRTEAAGFVIGDSEPVAVALQRITTDQFTQAIAALSDHRTEIGAAAHAASQNLTRIAAVVRLARGAIGEKAYRIELAVLRDTTDLLSGLVAGEIEIQAIDHLRARYEPLLRPLVFSDLREQLLDRHQVLRLELLPAVRDGGELSLAVQQLRRACARFAAWPVDQPMYGRAPVPDSFDAFAEGLERAPTARAENTGWAQSQATAPTRRDGCGPLASSVIRSRFSGRHGPTSSQRPQRPRATARDVGRPTGCGCASRRRCASHRGCRTRDPDP